MTLELWGNIPLPVRSPSGIPSQNGEDLSLGIDDPARYAQCAIQRAVARYPARRHIRLAGSTRRGRGDRAEDRKIPLANLFSIDQLDPIGPRRNFEAAGLTEVEQHRPGSCSRVNTRGGPPAVSRSRSGMRRPSSGCPAPRS